jgi:hypothetical protein
LNLAQAFFRRGQRQQALAVRKALKSVCLYPVRIECEADALSLEGVGPKLAREIIKAVNIPMSLNRNTDVPQDNLQPDSSTANYLARTYKPEKGKGPWLVCVALFTLGGYATKNEILEQAKSMGYPHLRDTAVASAVKSLTIKGLIERLSAAKTSTIFLSGLGMEISTALAEEYRPPLTLTLTPTHRLMTESVTLQGSQENHPLPFLMSPESGAPTSPAVKSKSLQEGSLVSSAKKLSMALNRLSLRLEATLDTPSPIRMVGSPGSPWSTRTSEGSLHMHSAIDKDKIIPSPENGDIHLSGCPSTDIAPNLQSRDRLSISTLPVPEDYISDDDTGMVDGEDEVGEEERSEVWRLGQDQNSIMHTSEVEVMEANIQSQKDSCTHLTQPLADSSFVLPSCTAHAQGINSWPKYLMQNNVKVKHEVVLIVDSREKDAAMVEAYFAGAGLLCETRRLVLGDYLWLLRPVSESGPEVVLDCIIERKTTPDLAASIGKCL